MGRLFWKFFFFIWIAQVVTTIGVSSILWLKIRAQEERPLEIAQSPPAAFMVNAAASTLQFGGAPALKELLETRTGSRRSGVLAVDENDNELLGRDVAPGALDQARALAARKPGDADVARGVREIKAGDGHTYLLFLPVPVRGDRERGDGPPPPGRAGPGPGMERLPAGAPGAAPAGPPREGRVEGAAPDSPRTGESRAERPRGDEGRAERPREGPPRDGPMARRYLRDWRLFPLEPLIAGVFVSLIFAALLAFYISRPIKSLRGAFADAAAGRLETRVGPAMGARRDELADLGRDFDHMAGRLQDVIGAQRRLLHDVSHEMRSPLARMQAAIGLARQGSAHGAPPKPEKVATAIERVERETARIDLLVEELLTLSRLDAGVAAGRAEEINVTELLGEIVEDACFEAQACRREVSLDAGAEGVVKGTAELLHRAFENVIRNAIKHTAEGSTVTVSTRFDGARQLRVLVQDAGPGVPEGELEDIFTPFFRGSNGSGTEGHGLGLAIAHRVVRAHGGTISAANRPEGGLTVTIALPLAGTPA
ncbi:MAG TPA: ATP-binding protein [Burkholderiales bacterium]